jgi:hypothetical protein
MLEATWSTSYLLVLKIIAESKPSSFMDVDIARFCSIGVLGISSHKPADRHIERMDFGKILYHLILTCF